MIDLKIESLITLAEAARLRPPGRAGRPTHPSTVFRWVSRGLRGIRLEAVRLGGATFTSVEAVQRFAERLSGGAGDDTAPASVARPDPDAAEAELIRRGC